MKFLIISILIFSSSIFAVECNDLEEVIPLPLFDLHDYANKLQENINWFSATDKDIDNAKCLDDEDFSDDAISSYLDSFGPEKISKSINGIKVTDHPKKIELLQRLLTSGYGDKELEMPKGSANCMNVNCISKLMFQDQSNNYLYLLDKYGLNLNADRKKYTDPWNKEEIQNIMNSINYLPKSLIPYGSNETFVRGKRSAQGGGTYANATVYFFDLHFTQTPQMQTYTIYHEIGHNMAGSLKLDQSEKWKELSSWNPEYELDANNNPVKDFEGLPKVKDWHAGHSHKMTSEYAKTNPAEDFAETFSAYRFTPEKLKEISPEKYKYMKDYIYQGAEFLTEESCKKESTLQYKLFNAEEVKLPSKIEDITVCKHSITAIVKNELSQQEITECTKKLMAQEAIKKSIADKNLKFDPIQIQSVLNSPLLPTENINPTKQQVSKTKKLLTEEIMNSAISKFNAYSTCDDLKNNLYQQLENIEEKITEFQFIYSQSKSINEGLFEICKEHQKVKSFKCSDYLYKLNTEESELKNNLCNLEPDKFISCNDDINSFKSNQHKDDFKKLCSSQNLEAPSKMECNRDTRAIFAKLLGIETNDLSKEMSYPDGRCKL